MKLEEVLPDTIKKTGKKQTLELIVITDRGMFLEENRGKRMVLHQRL